MENKALYLVLDRHSTPIACAEREAPWDAEQWQIYVMEDKAELIEQEQVVQLIGMKNGMLNLLGSVVKRRGNRLLLKPIRTLGEEIRQNLRIPVRFESMIYPVSGKWKGRLPVLGNDLSCGGVSFFCDYPLEVGEQMEIILPMTTHPLVVQSKILRTSSEQEGILYAAEFVDLVEDEVHMIREAVFSIQIHNHDKQIRKRKGKGRNENVAQQEE